MQPRFIALMVTILPLLAINMAYLLSAMADHIPWCVPYWHGCTSISRAARQGDAIYLFRVVMIVNAVLMIWYWLYIKTWLTQLAGKPNMVFMIILFLGIIGALGAILYADFLGETEQIHRKFRMLGVALYFTMTPMALLIQTNVLTKLNLRNSTTVMPKGVIHYQTTLCVLMFLCGLIGALYEVMDWDTNETENILEWNFVVVMSLFYLSNAKVWYDSRFSLHLGKTPVLPSLLKSVHHNDRN